MAAVTGGGVGEVALCKVPVLSQSVGTITAVACSLTPHAVELRALSESGALSTGSLSNAGGLGAEDSHRPRVDVNILNIDLGVKMQL